MSSQYTPRPYLIGGRSLAPNYLEIRVFGGSRARVEEVAKKSKKSSKAKLHKKYSKETKKEESNVEL